MNAITQPTPVAGTDSPAALLPEPKSTKELCARIASMNDTTVDPDDPVLMVYTIHTAALEDHAAMLLKARALLQDSLADATDAFARQTRDILETHLGDTVRQRLLTMQEAARLTDRAVRAMRRQVLFSGLIAAALVISSLVVLGAINSVLS